MPKTHEQIGLAGLTGWRQTLADQVAPPAAKRGPITEDQVQAVIGATFYVLSLWYVASTTVKIVKQLRSYRDALTLTDNAPERRFLERRLREVTG